MSKEAFKTFVRENPSLIKYVNNNTMTWQKFYEMYELYGTDNSVWNNYLKNNTTDTIKSKTTNTSSSISAERAFKELITTVKGLNLEKVQKGINSIQKTISLVQELGGSATSPGQYERRPIYKHFED